MTRTGLRMMPTFPSSPLRFRTASFPQYGSKAGLAVGAFPSHSQIKPPPGVPCPCSGLHPTFASSVATPNPRSESRQPARCDAAMQAAPAALPQGPSLRLCAKRSTSLFGHSPRDGLGQVCRRRTPAHSIACSLDQHPQLRDLVREFQRSVSGHEAPDFVRRPDPLVLVLAR